MDCVDDTSNITRIIILLHHYVSISCILSDFLVEWVNMVEAFWSCYFIFLAYVGCAGEDEPVEETPYTTPLENEEFGEVALHRIFTISKFTDAFYAL